MDMSEFLDFTLVKILTTALLYFTRGSDHVLLAHTSDSCVMFAILSLREGSKMSYSVLLGLNYLYSDELNVLKGRNTFFLLQCMGGRQLLKYHSSQMAISSSTSEEVFFILVQ